jgi:hypothetical protein
MEFSYNPLVEEKKPKDKAHPFAALCKAKQIELGNRSRRCPTSYIPAVDRTTLVKHPQDQRHGGSDEQEGQDQHHQTLPLRQRGAAQDAFVPLRVELKFQP